MEETKKTFNERRLKGRYAIETVDVTAKGGTRARESTQSGYFKRQSGRSFDSNRFVQSKPLFIIR